MNIYLYIGNAPISIIRLWFAYDRYEKCLYKKVFLILETYKSPSYIEINIFSYRYNDISRKIKKYE